jgi:uncharacterized membrane protein YvlD (DUF360 family)
MTVRGVVSGGLALWVAAHLVGGVSLAPNLDPLAAAGTLLLVALLLAVVDQVTAGVRRAIWLATGTAPLAIAATVAFNAALFWCAGNLAHAAGLGFVVTGVVAALAGSVLVRVVARALSLALTARRS